MSDRFRSSRRSLLAASALALPSAWLALDSDRQAFAAPAVRGPSDAAGTTLATGAIERDSSWTSFQAAPRHPEYPSDHGGRIGSGQSVLEALVGRSAPVPIALTSATAPGVTRVYDDWASISQDVIDARVWEGVHYRTSDLVGATLGRRVAQWELTQLHRLGI